MEFVQQQVLIRARPLRLLGGGGGQRVHIRARPLRLLGGGQRVHIRARPLRPLGEGGGTTGPHKGATIKTSGGGGTTGPHKGATIKTSGGGGGSVWPEYFVQSLSGIFIFNLSSPRIICSSNSRPNVCLYHTHLEASLHIMCLFVCQQRRM